MGTSMAWQMMTVKTRDELGIGVVAIEDKVASRTTMTYSPALSVMPCVSAIKTTTAGK